jgi:hypothetical protein
MLRVRRATERFAMSLDLLGRLILDVLRDLPVPFPTTFPTGPYFNGLLSFFKCRDVETLAL